MDEIYHHALKLLRRRDYTVKQLRQKLEAKLGPVPDDVITQLVNKRFLDDRRVAENLVRKRAGSHPARVREELKTAGVDRDLIEAVIANMDWPSLQDALKARMADWRLRAPLPKRDVIRLFRALSRLGYSEDELREELAQLHEEY
jgi:SOS response regulatory protein OraA/RecX